MLIQVGELAKRAGITVRTLHHYEQTGLLLPSARSAAGYRLYNLADVQRLHMIQALAKAGLELAEIRDFLEQESLSLTELLDAQITLLDKQLRSIHTLRDRLVELRTGLLDDATPDLESWLQTLELMNMYDRWFSKEELQQLPFAVQKDALAAIWSGLVAEANAAGATYTRYGRAGDGSGDALDGAPGAGHGGQAGVSHPAERDAQR
jgi:DNA-binding transcriptional MerR regulator